jgi:hypothetical protein
MRHRLSRGRQVEGKRHHRVGALIEGGREEIGLARGPHDDHLESIAVELLRDSNVQLADRVVVHVAAHDSDPDLSCPGAPALHVRRAPFEPRRREPVRVRDLLLRLSVVESLVGHVETRHADLVQGIADRGRPRDEVVERPVHLAHPHRDLLARIDHGRPGDGAHEAPAIGRRGDRFETGECIDRGAEITDLQLALRRDPRRVRGARSPARGFASRLQRFFYLSMIRVEQGEVEPRDRMLGCQRNGFAKGLDGFLRSPQDLQYRPIRVVRERIGGEAIHQQLRMGKRIGRAPGVQWCEGANLACLVAVRGDREGPGGELFGPCPLAGLHRLVRLADEGVDLCLQSERKRFQVKDL